MRAVWREKLRDIESPVSCAGDVIVHRARCILHSAQTCHTSSINKIVYVSEKETTHWWNNYHRHASAA
eukprot:76921-Rhodomonas_salina.1